MKKRALCVGINNYPGRKNDLFGCVNDANDWAAELKQRGYEVEKLLDKEATRDSMVGALTKLVRGASAGDTLVFTYSGHGSWLPDEDGDEADGRDEMLCPYDIDQQQYLMDDDLAEIFNSKPTGAHLFFISDSCHSGSVSRFAPQPIGGDDATQRRARLLPPEEFVKDARQREIIKRVALAPSTTRQKYPVVLVSGCKDVEVSYDASFNGRANGALTRAALEALKNSPRTPRDWMAEIRKHLPTPNYPQTPQLYGGRAAKAGPMF